MVTMRIGASMALKIKDFLVALLLLLIPLSSGMVEGFRENMHAPRHVFYKDGMKMNSRKLFGHEYVLDYGEAGASQKHKKPGKGP